LQQQNNQTELSHLKENIGTTAAVDWTHGKTVSTSVLSLPLSPPQNTSNSDDNHQHG